MHLQTHDKQYAQSKETIRTCTFTLTISVMNQPYRKVDGTESFEM